MTNPPILVITGLGGYFILNFLQKSGFYNKMTELYTFLYSIFKVYFLKE